MQTKRKPNYEYVSSFLFRRNNTPEELISKTGLWSLHIVLESWEEAILSGWEKSIAGKEGVLLAPEQGFRVPALGSNQVLEKKTLF